MAEAEARSETHNLRVAEGAEPSSEDLVGEYLGTLSGRSTSTVEAYGTILGVATVTGASGKFAT